jgi:hypothetical protein
MRIPNKTRRFFQATIWVAWIACSIAGTPQSEWQHKQEFSLAAPGLVKISLPVETLDAARPALEDLRICDNAGKELPFLITRSVVASKVAQAAKTFQTSLQQNSTVITIETGLSQPLDAVTLETPEMNFIKAVSVEGSRDGQDWQWIAQGQPIFRQLYGTDNLRASFSAGAWRWLRLTIDDRRSQPVPFTGAILHAAEVEATPIKSQNVTIVERNENVGETRLMLNLGAANLDVASLKIESKEPLFTRAVRVAVPQISEDSVSEQTVGEGVIYRVAIEGRPPSGNLSVPLETKIGSRELVLLIRNEDSPPLAITSVSVNRRQVYLVFMARSAGRYYLLTGNRVCAAPQYDLAALGEDLKNAVVTPVAISALANNPNYHPSEALAGLQVTGAELDVSAWRFRKTIQCSRNGAQQFELDLDMLAHARTDFADLRLVNGSNQVPYLIQRTSISRALSLPFAAAKDAKYPKLSRWHIKLPKANLPLTRLTCATTTPVFQRTLFVSEELTDERGGKYVHRLGSAMWMQTPERRSKEFSLELDSPTKSDMLILETENGDNPAIEIFKFTAFYSATHMLFRAKTDDKLFLYYGNSRVASPRYDLSLVAGDLLAADKTISTLGTEEQLKTSSWTESKTLGTGGILFWGILAVVVIGLLAVISRLLPKTALPTDDQMPKP